MITIPHAYWQDGKLHLTVEEDSDIAARRERAKVVVRDYEWSPTASGVKFRHSVEVQLSSDRVGCTCMDMRNRRKLCKHIFAAAHLLGDTDALSVRKSKARQTLQKWRPQTRPQDVRVGRYFVLSDFLYNETAIAEGVANCPPFDCLEVEGMKGLCDFILDPVVEHFGPISITFAYVGADLAEYWGRSPTAKTLHQFRPPQGGIGGAADIVIHSYPDPRIVLNWVRDNCVFDRIILYPGSRILCLAWTQIKPRSHCKEWVFVEGGKPQYLTAGIDGRAELRSVNRQLDLSDRF